MGELEKVEAAALTVKQDLIIYFKLEDPERFRVNVKPTRDIYIPHTNPPQKLRTGIPLEIFYPKDKSVWSLRFVGRWEINVREKNTQTIMSLTVANCLPPQHIKDLQRRFDGIDWDLVPYVERSIG